MDVESVLEQMTLEEKCACLTGEGYWVLGGCPRLGVAPIEVSDGPHGLRHQSGAADNLGLSQSDPAVCFPTASASACSFDVDLLRRMGEAIGDEAREQGVAVVLGPGVNMKRSPLCGRNFEYFSEDPFLAGTLGAAYIQGVQSRGVGASLKHFACNNQETHRLISDSVVDERALHELYLEPFRLAVEQGKPWTIMTAYNLINGTYCSENPWLMEEVGRKAWGFDGAYVCDWGAESSNADSLPAGLDLVMPGVRPDYRLDVADAVRAGRISRERLDDAVRRVLQLHDKHERARDIVRIRDLDARLEVAREVAEQSAVLLKNEGALPLELGARIAVIGAFAKHPRYQGAGSSKINPVSLDCAFDELVAAQAACSYAEGYDRETGAATEAQLEEAAAVARRCDAAVVFVGLPDASESEGADRSHMGLPEGHDSLVERVCAANPNTVVVLQGGSPVELPWRDRPNAILLSYLAGCCGGKATADVLLGRANPSGKLAETWPVCLVDTPCADFFPATGRQAHYRESVFSGYRYYDAAGVEVAYPFGHGLSYTRFSYESLHIEAVDDGFAVSCTVRNVGDRFGREAVQLYVAPLDDAGIRPVQQLKAFAKVALEPGEERRVELALPRRAFAHYDPETSSWEVFEGAYDVRVSASSQDVRLRVTLDVAGVPRAGQAVPQAYRAVHASGFADEAFRALYAKPYPKVIVAMRPYTPNATVGDLKASLVGCAVHWILRHELKLLARSDPAARAAAERMVMDTPLRTLAMSGVDMGLVDGAVDILNYRFFRGFKRLRRVLAGASASEDPATQA
ncbi:glycoside hydrolase family 3 C-terminal domain-containing protein [Paraeggerthella hongkongensis]|uniref:glycoside hydrolase family 3 C-terminal domain-containing protein n=1 Tax=Paraeggerthella TaxID=651554 RepID=UPI001C117803|nr:MULTISPECIES: glycoside hydrolase family 3 C-terminal domain-containing protein [Paraeggerthella]MBU5406226.1 glycoside hydrolase family 3 C-terminal domain-containing protein [Paraeggerthella hongkongensis]MCD2434076.1 glycoside hydrolase family 3 C-terminal domain-containing protein [Paraeggerthella hominis]